MTTPLTDAEQGYLLMLARTTLEAHLRTGRTPPLALEAVPAGRLRAPSACFVTLMLHGALRGCTGTLEAREPLYAAVRHSAVQTALNDPRFMPLTLEELAPCVIEVSVLGAAERFVFQRPADLLAELERVRPGVVLNVGRARATFLPQVWEMLPDAREFMAHLCAKAGLWEEAWQGSGAEVWLYGVEKFEEAH